ncbi:outer envelope protein 80, chloroplastic-like isoform X2 [Solanum dulcamara]|uniref:outer envelope protein 80, chloroplastic-like isoform X2 n=1 Tax=Solanum dulcamara TaxID=45834 RepID=UPI002485D8FD|nr:outer envelope protein 80, chloroplastic-like isoform X2 [Solanum dulcamara]
MLQNEDVRFTSSAIKLPLFSPPPLHHHTPNPFFTNLHLILQNFPKFPHPFRQNLNPKDSFLQTLSKFQHPFHHKFNPQNAILQFLRKPINPFSWNLSNTPPLLCCASIALSQSNFDDSSSLSPKTGSGNEERVLISEVLVRSKDGEELERKDLESEVLNALKACRPNSALTVQEVQEDVHRIIASGYFCSCMPIAVDTRDGIRLVFQVEPNQEFHGLVCEGANVLPARFIEDSFRDGYGKIVNIKWIDEIISSINGWYMERGLFGAVSGVEILSGGMIRLEVSEAEVNNIAIRFLDKTGEPTVGKTRPETILRQLTTKKGQVYSMLQGKRDVDTVLAMGIMEDVSIIPQPAGDTGKVDLVMNIVERKIGGGISAGGGISSGITSGPLAGLIGSCAIYHKNLFGRNQKLNLSLERGQVDSVFRINYTDPWIEGDDKRTSRSIMIQNSRTPGTLVHSQPDGSLTIGRVTAGIEYSRPFRPKWNGTAGIIFQRAGARDDKGSPIIRDYYSSPLTASGNTHDDMLLAKLETVYTGSSGPGSSVFVFNMDQGLPVWSDWLVFNRVNARARKGLVLGPMHLLLSFSGGHMVGNFPPHEAFAIGGTNSVRGYEEGAVGSSRSYVVGCGEISFPLMGPVEGAVFADYGSDLGSGRSVPGDPAGPRRKPGSGYGCGVGICVDSPLGPLRLEYAFNDQRTGRFHFGVGLRN